METNNKKNGRFWTKFTTLQKRLVIIMTTIIAATYLYPRVVNFIQYISGLVNFHNQRNMYESQIKMLVNYAEVDRGLSKAQMEKGDSIDRYVLLDKIDDNGNVVGHVEVKVDIRRQKSGDYKIFVPDGNVGVYGTYFNWSLDEWEYYDFKNQHHVTYSKD